MGCFLKRYSGFALFLLCAMGLPARADLMLLSPAQEQVIAAPPDEKPYNVRLHFLQSNEHRHDMFFSTLRGRGGGYVGVGADQNYTLAAVAGATYVWLVDIDEEVMQWHHIYQALIPAARSPDDLCLLFDGKHQPEVRQALVARFSEAEARPLLRAFERDRGRLRPYLLQEKGLQKQGQPVTWLSDPALYQRVRDLMVAHRVVARIGDLHGEHTLMAIASAAGSTHVTIRSVYLSNAEQWFRYSSQFRRNIAALPRDDRSVVLRTLARPELTAPEGDRWHFSVQGLDNFVQRLTAQKGSLLLVQGLIGEMVQAQKSQGTRGLSFLTGVVPVTTAQVGSGFF